MGYYIECPFHLKKADQLLLLPLAAELPGPPVEMGDVPVGQTLVCVVENGPFDAAAVIYNEMELTDFLATDRDQRPRRWLLLPAEIVRELVPGIENVL